MTTEPSVPHVRLLEADDVARCEQILLALPDWFGIPESNDAYVASLSSLPGAVASIDDRIAGFLALVEHDPGSVEIHVMAVDAGLHRQGTGRALVTWAEDWCRARRARWLHVKTRGPSTPDPAYERTRHFYEACGFEPLFESTTLWGPQDAALILVKSLEAAPVAMATGDTVAAARRSLSPPRQTRLTEDMKRVVREQRLGFMATVADDGTPNLSPKGLTFVLDDGHLLIGEVRSPRTVSNLARRPTAEIDVVDPVARKGYRFKGPCQVHVEGAEFDRLVASLRSEGARSPLRSVIVMTVARARPLVSPAYDDGTPEREVRARNLRRILDLNADVVDAGSQRPNGPPAAAD